MRRVKRWDNWVGKAIEISDGQQSTRGLILYTLQPLDRLILRDEQYSLAVAAQYPLRAISFSWMMLVGLFRKET